MSRFRYHPFESFVTSLFCSTNPVVGILGQVTFDERVIDALLAQILANTHRTKSFVHSAVGVGFGESFIRLQIKAGELFNNFQADRLRTPFALQLMQQFLSRMLPARKQPKSAVMYCLMFSFDRRFNRRFIRRRTCPEL